MTIYIMTDPKFLVGETKEDVLTQIKDRFGVVAQLYPMTNGTNYFEPVRKKYDHYTLLTGFEIESGQVIYCPLTKEIEDIVTAADFPSHKHDLFNMYEGDTILTYSTKREGTVFCLKNAAGNTVMQSEDWDMPIMIEDYVTNTEYTSKV